MVKLIRTAENSLFAIQAAIKNLEIVLKEVKKSNWKYERDLFTGDEIIKISKKFYERHKFSILSSGYRRLN